MWNGACNVILKDICKLFCPPECGRPSWNVFIQHLCLVALTLSCNVSKAMSVKWMNCPTFHTNIQCVLISITKWCGIVPQYMIWDTPQNLEPPETWSLTQSWLFLISPIQKKIYYITGAKSMDSCTRTALRSQDGAHIPGNGVVRKMPGV